MKRLSFVLVFLTSSLISVAPDLKEVDEVKKLQELIEKQHHEARYYRKLALVQATTGALLEYTVSEHFSDFADDNTLLVKGALVALVIASGLATHYLSKKEEREESSIPESVMVGGLSAVGAAGFMAIVLGGAKLMDKLE